MKYIKFFILLSLILGFSVKPVVTRDILKKSQVHNSVDDKLMLYPASSVKVEGYLGDKMNLCIEKRIKAQNVDHLVEPFRHKDETRLWQSEFWGKWILSAIGAYDYNHDPELLTTINNAVIGLLATQMPNGYIGNYSDEASLQQWDIWGRKYTLLGLLAYYDLTGNKNALNASKRLADHLLTQVVLGTDREGKFRDPKQVSFCDFASAGNTWGEDSRYLVWIRTTLNVMKTDYKSY